MNSLFHSKKINSVIALLCCSIPSVFAQTGTASSAASSSTASSQASYSIVIESNVPGDIVGGAPNADLKTAAVFAWQEFIALNWPAMSGSRDQPDIKKYFGQTTGGPLVWETFRHKAEIFPASGKPHGYSQGPSTDYGYDEPPQYVYSTSITACPSATPGTSSSSSSSSGTITTPWVNLDENSQIGLAKMFAGVAPDTHGKTSQQILFLAKANRTEYRYVAKNQWYGDVTPPFAATAKNLAATQKSAPPGSSNFVSFPFGTIEVKSAWRQLTPAELASGKFHTTTVRYYEQLQSASANTSSTNASSSSASATPSICYRDAIWGLVGLHIIQKTPTAPYFIFATFEQTDNLLDSNGNPIEDVDGSLIRNADKTPMNPQIISKNATSANPASPESIQSLSPKTANCTPGDSLYYQNIPTQGNLINQLPKGTVCIQKRVHDIPADIIAINKIAHQSIKNYNTANKIKSSPWSYYKLINVQTKPGKVAGVDYTGMDAATFYQANSMIETDYNLQVFSGVFQHALKNSPTTPYNNLITDFNADGTPAVNTRYAGTSYNMGGCMGCHGNAQAAGSDFSFILLGQRVTEPDTLGEINASGSNIMTQY
jgi:hypothetical protein